MDQHELIEVFDRHAEGYDQQWATMAPIRDALHLLVESSLLALPADARVLGVGVGTGVELGHLARRFPSWQLTAVEPSSAMLDLCRRRAEREGFADRCTFHHGYLATLPDGPGHHAATSFLVSQFLLDRDARVAYVAGIAERLRSGGVLVSADLSADVESFEPLLRTWLTVMAGPDVSEERIDAARAAYARDVAIRPPAEVASIIEDGGFDPPVLLFQAGLLHAWRASKA